MIDAPSYDFNDENEVQEIVLTEDNNQQIMNFVNSMM
nr:MAG TPA: hypothetical protein [Caudoviricetes sp.]